MNYEESLKKMSVKYGSIEAEAIFYLGCNREELYKITRILGIFIEFSKDNKIEIYDDAEHHLHRATFDLTKKTIYDFIYLLNWDLSKIVVLMELVIKDFY